MLALGLPYMAFIMLRYVPSMPTLWRVFIINDGEFCQAFSSSIEMIVWFLFFSLLMWCFTLIDVWILSHPYIPGINPTWSWCTILFFFFFLIFFFFIFLFLTVLGPCFCLRALSSCGKWGPLFIAVHGPLTIAACLAAEHRLQTRRLSSCGSRAQSLHGMWDPPRPGLEPVSPASAGGLSTTAPPGKPYDPFNVLLIWFANILLRIFASMFISDIGLIFSFLWYLLLVLVSGWCWPCRMSSKAYSSIFWNSLRKISVNSSLNVW